MRSLIGPESPDYVDNDETRYPEPSDEICCSTLYRPDVDIDFLPIYLNRLNQSRTTRRPQR